MNIFKHMAFSIFLLINTASNAAYFICRAKNPARDAWLALNKAQQTAAQVIAQKNAKNQALTHLLETTKLHAASQQPIHVVTTNLKRIPQAQTKSQTS